MSSSFATYSDFTQYLTSRKCPKCDLAFIKDAKDVQALFRKWQKGESSISPQVKCRKCSQSTCIACFDKAGGDPTRVTVEDVRLKWCCSRGRLFIIFVILCGFDQQYSAAKLKEASTTSTTDKYEKKRGGVGYAESGGYGGDYGKSYEADAGKAKAVSAEKAADSFDGSMFAFLATLLPSPDNNTNFDISPPEAVTSMLLGSKILNKAAELLRNDSLDNASKRRNLYDALVGFLRTIGTHEVTSKETMFSEREVMPDSVNLLTLSFEGKPRGMRKDTASSLADFLRNLNIQSNIMMKGALENKKEFDNQDGRDLLWLCRKISDLSSYLLGKDQNPVPVDDCGIAEVPEDKIYSTYYYYKDAKSLTQSPFGRIKTLITEITTLKTGLSSGIFVKHGASRLDVMKVVIIGPEGTPYAHGFFEFDIFCPKEYPNEPPKVWFKGTDGGTAWINPNLHSDGKVCLSLLGTFSGEPWRPGQSTILQVLISLQAMIFCEDPINNIPIQGGLTSDWFENEAFNQDIRGHTVKLALLDWARNPPKLWKDEVKLHFKKNGDAILKMVEQWSQTKSRGRYDDGIEISEVLPKLQKALETYGATYKVRSQGGTSSSRDGYRKSRRY